MDPVWYAFFSAIFIIMILKSEVDMMEEEKYFLREDNISLRNDLKKVNFRMEGCCNQDWPEEWVRVKEKIKKKNQKKLSKNRDRDRIFIFEDGKSEEDAERLVSFRNFLKEHSINDIVLVDFETLALKLPDDGDDSVIEEILVLGNNPDNLPIIFYGGDPEDFLSFLLFFNWIERIDMGWIEDPWDIEDLKDILEEIEEIEES